jgi:hypothetical protein
MQADLTTPIDLGQSQDTYFTFLVRENTAPLMPSQLSSSNRTLALQFLNASGVNQFDFTLRGFQHQIAIQSQADISGQDVFAGGFASDTTYLVVGKLSGNGTAANTMQASLFASGAVVGNFTTPGFQWMLSAQGSAGYNPIITDIQFSNPSAANYTVSNVWIGSGAALIPLTLTSHGDFNQDGIVNSADYAVWRNTMGQSGSALAADGNGNWQVDAGDLTVWRAYFGQAVSVGGGGEFLGAPVPEPSSYGMFLLAAAVLIMRRAARSR